MEVGALYQVGDKIVHPMHGAGVIDAIVKKKMNGVTRDYYNLKLPTGSMMVLIPTDHTDDIGVRPVVDAQKADKLLEEMRNIDVDVTQNWNHRYRENMIRLKSGDLIEVARVVKSLVNREKSRGLSTGERKMLHSAKQILISELVLSKNSSYEAMEEYINKVLI